MQVDMVFDDWGERTERLVTGHSPRRVGAQWLTKLGLTLWQVMYIGRWGSRTVERYVGEAAAWNNSKLSTVAATSTCTSIVSEVREADEVPWWIVKN